MTDPAIGSNSPTILTVEQCLELLGSRDIGRVAVVHEGYPVVFPVNYRLAADGEQPVIAIRTRTGNTIDQPDQLVGFQIDGIDAGHDSGWSVLVRGRLVTTTPSEQFDSHPLVADERDAWRLIVPATITGRRVHAHPAAWPFHPDGYL